MAENNNQYSNNNKRFLHPESVNSQNQRADDENYNRSFAPPPQNTDSSRSPETVPPVYPKNNESTPPPPNINDIPSQQPKKKMSCLVFAILGAIALLILIAIIIISAFMIFIIRNKSEKIDPSTPLPTSSVTSALNSRPESSTKIIDSEGTVITDYQSAIDTLLDSIDPQDDLYIWSGTADLEYSQFDLDEDGIPEVIVGCSNNNDGFTYRYGQLFHFDGKKYVKTGNQFVLPTNDETYPRYDTNTRTLLTKYSDENGSYESYYLLSYSNGYLYTQDSIFAQPTADSFGHNDATITKNEYQRLIKDFIEQCTESTSFTLFSTYEAPPQVTYIAEATVNTEKDPLNMRLGPGKDYDIIFKVPKGETVYIIEWDGDWAYAEYNSENEGKYTGYLSKEYLKIT